ncbi:trypsin-like serine peptidase [Peredibacter starrii]|uniref:Serine protease n=1 Tax=Peredibacter starrii TaxID=28202 RepID=A0AAX4HQJ8_9BACT|nr:serine protease [Peredibacter starrii]WPU65442.1 serine protease [Peredibacter starrii]
MNFTKLLVLLVLSTLLASCGQNSNGKKIISLNSEEMNKMMSEQTFECASENGSNCPDGIARLFVVNEEDPTRSSVCSGFLNGDNRLVTNNHCLSTLSQCKATYISIYSSKGLETARCKSIIHTEVDGKTLNQKAVDFTVLELDHKIQNSKPLPVAKRQAYQGEKLIAWVVDQINNRQARITELNCNLSRKAKSLELQNCPVISGNSGSPVLNEQGELSALIWGSTADETVNEETSLFERRSLNEYAFATDLKHFLKYLIK